MPLIELVYVVRDLIDISATALTSASSALTFATFSAVVSDLLPIRENARAVTPIATPAARPTTPNFVNPNVIFAIPALPAAPAAAVLAVAAVPAA